MKQFNFKTNLNKWSNLVTSTKNSATQLMEESDVMQ